jgi:TusA-related sulfurtransferase
MNAPKEVNNRIERLNVLKIIMDSAKAKNDIKTYLKITAEYEQLHEQVVLDTLTWQLRL